MMIRALKMTAERMADCGVRQVHDVEDVQLREGAGEHGGDDGEIFGYVVGDGKSGERAASDQQLLADFHDLDELGGIGIEIDHVAGFLGGLRAGVHGYADIGLSEGGSVVGAVAGHGDEFAFGLLALDQRHFVFGLGFGEKIVDSGLAGDGRGGERVVAGDHHGANAHGAEVVETLAHAAFDDVGEGDDAEHAAVFGDEQRSAAGVGNIRYVLLDFGRNLVAAFGYVSGNGFRRLLCGFAGRRDRRRTCGSARKRE